jgi:hypothetical protein
MSISDSITQLRSNDGKLLTKRWLLGADGKPVQVQYERAMWFSVQSHNVSSIHSLADVLELISRDPYSCVIRGELINRSCAHRTRRQSINFRDVPRWWSLHDLDDLQDPVWIDWRKDPEAVVRYAVERCFPAQFHGASCWWSFSSSQGLKDGIRLRLAFYHDRPVGCDEWKLWLAERIPDLAAPHRSWRKVHPVDAALYSSVQCNYVAPPIFDGVEDPVPRRSGLLLGEHDVVEVPLPIVPRFSTYSRPRQQARKPADGERPVRQAASEHTGGSGYAFHLSRIGDGNGQDGFYAPMRAAVAAYIHQHGPETDANRLHQEVADAARAATRDPNKHAIQDVESRIVNLPAQIAWVLAEETKKAAIENAPGAICDPPRALPTASLAEAQTALAEATRMFFAELPAIVDEQRRHLAAGAPLLSAEDDGPSDQADKLSASRIPHVAIATSVGAGKTEAAIRELAALTVSHPTYRAAYFAPTHTTAEEVARRLDKAAGRPVAAVWRGTERPDPNSPDHQMCRMHKAVKEAREVGGSVRDICGSSKAGCPHHPRRAGQSAANACAYRRQYSAEAQIYVFPHSMLASRAPLEFLTGARASLGPFDLVVLDEAPWLGMFGGLSTERVHLTGAEIAAPLPSDKLGIDDRAKYQRCVRALLDNLSEPGLLKRSTLAETGLTAEGARWVSLTIRKALPKPALHVVDVDQPAGSGPLGTTETLPHGGRLIRLWQEIARFLASRQAVAPWTLEVGIDEAGAPGINVRWRKEIHRDWVAVPLLYLDATLVPEVARCWLPHLQVRANIEVADTHVLRIGLSDRGMGKTAISPDADQPDDEQARRANRRRAVCHLGELAAAEFRGRGHSGGPDVALVTYLAPGRHER